MDKNELKNIIQCDLSRYDGHIPGIKDLLLHNEGFYISRYMRHMRFMEYHRGKGFVHKCPYLWHWYFLKRLQFKLHVAIYPNTVGPGFRLYHIGAYTHIGPNVKIGKNCTIVSGVVFGNKYIVPDDNIVSVGDNCYFGIGCKIFGSVNIGDNVIVGANAIISKDIPDNAVVVGNNHILRIRKEQ